MVIGYVSCAQKTLLNVWVLEQAVCEFFSGKNSLNLCNRYLLFVFIVYDFLKKICNIYPEPTLKIKEKIKNVQQKIFKTTKKSTKSSDYSH